MSDEQGRTTREFTTDDFRDIIDETIRRLRGSVSHQTGPDIAADRLARAFLLKNFQENTKYWSKATFSFLLAIDGPHLTQGERSEVLANARTAMSNSDRQSLRRFRRELDTCEAELRDTYTRYSPRHYTCVELTDTDVYFTQTPEESLLDYVLSLSQDALEELSKKWYHEHQRVYRERRNDQGGWDGGNGQRESRSCWASTWRV